MKLRSSRVFYIWLFSNCIVQSWFKRYSRIQCFSISTIITLIRSPYIYLKTRFLFNVHIIDLIITSIIIITFLITTKSCSSFGLVNGFFWLYILFVIIFNFFRRNSTILSQNSTKTYKLFINFVSIRILLQSTKSISTYSWLSFSCHQIE